jgi:hypothetical protein
VGRELSADHDTGGPLEADAGDIRDESAEPVDVEHLASHSVRSRPREGEGGQQRIVRDRPQRGQRLSGGESGRCRSKHIAPVKRCRCFWRHRKLDRGGALEDRREEPIVWSDEAVAAGLYRESPSDGADSGIHHGEVHRADREAMPGSGEQVLRGAAAARRYLMGNVDDRAVGHRGDQHGLDLGDVAVPGTEVGQERDDRHVAPCFQCLR